MPLLPPRNLRLLWLGQMLSALGDRLHEIALMWIAVQAIGGRAGLVAVAGSLARMAFGLLGGVYADRWDRRRTMIATDLLRCAVVATLALASLQGPLSLWHLATVAALLGALDSLFGPALQASLPALAPDSRTLQQANALLNVTHRLALIVGPSLTGVLLAWIPISQFFSIDTATFAASALAIAALGRGYEWKPRGAAPAPGLRGIANEISTALRLVVAHPPLAWGIALLSVWNVSYGAAQIVGFPLFARDVLGGGPDTYGYLMGAYGVGNVASNLVIAGTEVKRRTLLLFTGGVVYGIGLFAFAWSPDLWVALALGAATALGGPMTDVMLLTIVQTDFPAGQIGKVWSFRMTASRASLGVGLLVAGPLFSLLPVRTGIASAGVFVLLFSLVALYRTRSS